VLFRVPYHPRFRPKGVVVLNNITGLPIHTYRHEGNVTETPADYKSH
jgi:hypothetical protein